jgi:hypothetical protein
MKRVLTVLIAIVLSSAARAETITVATYNIENFKEHFLARRVAEEKVVNKIKDEEVRKTVADMLAELRNANDEDNWETAQVILDPKFSPDILVFEEGCDQADLDEFNKKWLGGAYETAIVFPGNSGRGQTVGLLAKPGFKVVDRKDQYYLEPDSVKNERGDRLFARGPAFALIQTPSGYRFWVGVTHQKSKSGNNVEVTQWRNREAKRTHAIIKEIERQGPSDVMLLGDMNDELGVQQYEQEGGGDTIANLVGPPEDGLELVTRKLAESGVNSYNGYWRTDFRSFIDHVIVTKSMKDQIEDVNVFHDEFTPVSSDHAPVYVKIHSDPAPTTLPAGR